MQKNIFKTRFKFFNFLMLTIAGIINSIGVTIFLAPVSLYDSGISGTSILLGNVTGLSLSLFLICLNIPLFLYGLKKQGLAFTIYAIYTVSIYSICAFIIENLSFLDFSKGSPIAGEDMLLCGVFGGLISGIGSGLAIRYSGAMDGIEVMSVIFAKKIGITVGTFVMIYNTILYIIGGIVTASWQSPLYSVIAYVVALKTIDFIVEGIDRSKSANIVTTKAEEVCSALSEYFKCGMTIMDGMGYYSNTEKKIIYIVINRFQISKMRNIVHAIDPMAYISISEVAEVFKAKKK